MRAKTCLLLLTVVALFSLAACQGEAETGGDMPRAEDPGHEMPMEGDRPAGAQPRDINVVMEENAEQLMAIEGVTGVAVGETPEGTPCIMVMVLELTETMRQALPEQLEGHPVCPFESGEIRPMGGE